MVNAKITNSIPNNNNLIINNYFTAQVQVLALEEDITIGDTEITISSTSEPTNGNTIGIKSGDRTYQGTILSHSADEDNWTVVLDSPIDYAHTTYGVKNITERTDNMAVDGSTTAVSYIVGPKGMDEDVEWEVIRIIGTILDGTEMDDSKFGGIAALTNGCLLRYKCDGNVYNIFNFKSNQDLTTYVYDVKYADKAKSGKYGFSFRRTFNGKEKNDTAIRLQARNNGLFEILIQDDLSDLDSFKVSVQGKYKDTATC